MNKLPRRIYLSQFVVILLTLVLLAGCQMAVSPNTPIIPNCPPYKELYFVDAHSQVAKFFDIQIPTHEEMTVNEIEDFILQKMRTANVKRSILAPRAGQSHETIVNISNSHRGSGRIYPAIAVKGNYYLRFQQRIGSGNFHAIGEVLLYHAEKEGIGAKEFVLYPSDPVVQRIYKVAKQKGWPLVIHIEDAAMPKNVRRRMNYEMCRVGINYASSPYIIGGRSCEQLYQQELDMTDHPVVFIHMAQLPPERVKRLISQHSNLYFMTSHSNPTSYLRPQPWINMFDNDQLTEDWAELITMHPKRFIFALDNVIQEHWIDDYVPLVELWQNALMILPEHVAHAVAHGNAERLWRLPPLCDHGLPEDTDATSR